MGKTAGAKDKKKRIRREYSDEEKRERKRKRDLKKAGGSVANHFFHPPAAAANDASHPADNAPYTVDDAHHAADAGDTHASGVDDDDVIIFSEEVHYPRNEDIINIVANLDVEDPDNMELDHWADAEPDDNNKRASKVTVKKGIQQDFMRAIHDRLKCEAKGGLKALEPSWLLDHLRENDWWIRKEQAWTIIKYLKHTKKSESTYADVEIQTHNKLYYRDINFWMPEEMWEGVFPPCPTCKSDKDVETHGFNSDHIGRLVIGVHENYNIITRRYKCKACEKRKRELEKDMKDGETVKLKYTHMGWDPVSLSHMAFGCGDEFPAELSHKAALDKSLHDMMRAEFANGVKADTFAKKILEYHSKHYHRCYLRYERQIMIEKYRARRLNLTDNKVHEMFSEFYDEYQWADNVPTGGYFRKEFKRKIALLRPHYSKEVKKRGAKTLAIDASYKSAKRLAKVGGASVFKGLITGANEIGEVRVQHHVVSDSHDQIKGPLEAFIETTNQYGLPQPNIIFTDDPSRDDKFLTKTFQSVREEKDKLNADVPQHNAQSKMAMYPYDANSPVIKTVDTARDINLAVSAINTIIDNAKGLALDCEWKVEFSGNGRKKEWKISLIQLAYYNTADNTKQYLLIRTHKLSTLPSSLVLLLVDNSVNVVGVNVGGDLARIGRDFGIESTMAKRDKITVINLGSYARKRDAVENGSIGMKPLVKAVLGYDMEKMNEDKFSDWNANKLSDSQIKYAVIDVCAPLECYQKLQDMPDLTIRLTMEDVVAGKTVDLVPRNGSVACMATRAATGCILGTDDVCQSPDGIVQKKVRAGSGMVAIQLTHVYSPRLKLPHYQKQGSGAPTLADFSNGRVVVPVQMLKDHVQSEAIRAYPTDDPNATAGITPPSSNRTDTESTNKADADSSDISSDAPNGGVIGEAEDEDDNNEEDEDDNNEEDEYTTGEQVYESVDALTSSDIEYLRAAVVEGDESASGRPPLVCDGLQDPPKPDEISDVYSPVLGDIYHAMNRPYVATKHDAKKGYYFALQNAMYVYDENTMAELVRRMEADGMTKDDIESRRYYNSRMFNKCVPRTCPPPSILYWRVRAVYAMYGNIVDSKTNKPLFNKQAWNKAQGVLDEILKGYYSDPPGIQLYTKKLMRDGSVKRNKYGMDEIECRRGTNRTESYHKKLAGTFYGHHQGVEMTDCLLAEMRHRHNHACSELRRSGYPTFGHVDTWLPDQIQNLVLRNHGVVLWKNWSNASDYIETNERFDTVAIHNSELHRALKEQCETIDKTKVHLTLDRQYLCECMGIDLPFLPFTTEEENKLFALCVLRNDFPTDNDEAVVAWMKYVDGVKIFPKLPVHWRIHKEAFERNQRVRTCTKAAKAGKEKLDELNAALMQNEKAPVPINIPEPMPTIKAQAMHNLPYVSTGGTMVGKPPEPSRKQTSVRGLDTKQRAKRRCGLCLQSGDANTNCEKGRGGRALCEYWNENGTRKV